MNNSTKVQTGITLVPQNTTSPSVDGDLRYNSSTNKVELYNGAVDPLVTEADTATLTNKTISGASNTITNVSLTTGVTGTLPVGNGGTGQTSFASGALSSNGTVLTSGTLSVANGGTGTTTSTGSGSVVLSSAPTLTNPVVGTQTQLDGSTKAASTSYVDTAVANAVAGLNPAVAVQAATTAAGDTSGFTYLNGVSGVGATFTGTANTAVTIDGYTFTATGQRLLVKNDTQSANPGAYNGIYFVTQIQTLTLPPIFTRALDYDQPTDINNTGAIPVINGTVNTTTSWVQTGQIVTVGTTPLVFVKFSNNPSTDLTNPMTTAGDMIYGGASGTPTRLVTGTSGQVPISTGSTVAFGTLQGNSTALKAPTFQILTSTGSQTGWLFTISTSTTCAVGDTYTNNGHTYTVQTALSAQSGQVLFMSGTGATSGTTLTRSSGSGTSSITFSATLATATYTTPSGPAPLYLRIRMVGGGGGGAGSGSAGQGGGLAGGTTAFSGGILLAGGGIFGTNFGVVSLQSGGNIINAQGQSGGGRIDTPSTSANFGGLGGSSLLGGGGNPGTDGSMTGTAGGNYGGGGGGAGSTGTNSVTSNAGGGGGGYVEHILSSPGASYAYAVGAGGAGGAAGTNGGAGGAGAGGVLIIDEYYQ